MVGEVSLGLGIEFSNISRLQPPVLGSARLTAQPWALVWLGFNGLGGRKLDPGAL